MDSSDKGHILLVDGLPGSGKTTLIKELSSTLTARRIHHKVFLEEVDDTLLEKYLSDMKAYALSFQLHMALKKQTIYHQASEFAKMGYIVIIDRSIRGDFAFASTQNRMRYMSCDDFEIYRKDIEAITLSTPHTYLVLDVTVETAMRRIEKRGNSDVDLDSNYFSLLLRETKDALRGYNPSYMDWNGEFNRNSLDGMVNALCKFAVQF